MNEVKVKQNIEKDFPDITVKKIDFHGEGMDSRAFLINESIVFRFPKHFDVAQQLNVEIKLLPMLKQYTRIEIPNFEYVGCQLETNLPYVGYKIIKGVPFTKDIFKSLNGNEQDIFAFEIAHFLQQLHSFPIDKAQECGVRIFDVKQEFIKNLEILKSNWYQLLDNGLIEYIENLHTIFFTNEELFKYSPVLVHADLDPNHILYDQNKLAGIIDFGDIMLTDPDFDLIPLYLKYKDVFFEKFLKYYKHPNLESLMEKLKFYKKYNPLYDVVLGLNRKDEDLIQWSIEEFKKGVKILI